LFCCTQIPEVVGSLVPKSRKDPIGRKRDEVDFAVKGRKNFNRNFVRAFGANFRGLNAVALQSKTGNILKTNDHLSGI
jgi:hypothetical protein